MRKLDICFYVTALSPMPLASSAAVSLLLLSTWVHSVTLPGVPNPGGRMPVTRTFRNHKIKKQTLNHKNSRILPLCDFRYITFLREF